MKKKILIGIVIGIILLWLCIFLIDKNRIENFKEPIFVIKQYELNDGGSYRANGIGYTVDVYKSLDTTWKMEMYIFNKCVAGCIAQTNILVFDEQSSVIIKNNQIQNEDLIDEFIQNAINKKDDILEINIEGQLCKVEFISAKEDTKQYNKDGSVTVTIPQYNGEMSEAFDIEYAKKYYGYYKVTYSDGVKEEYSSLAFGIKRMIKDNKVIVYFTIVSPTVYIALTDDLKTICEYSLESSNYKKLVDLSYFQRKDMGLKKIAEKNEFDNKNFEVYTLGGDVNFTVEKDMVYDFRKALEDKVIMVNDIIEQANLDYKYGICDMHYFKDGGSVEYLYDNYTILKCNSLDGNTNIYIGFKGTILNIINKK